MRYPASHVSIPRNVCEQSVNKVAFFGAKSSKCLHMAATIIAYPVSTERRCGNETDHGSDNCSGMGGEEEKGLS